jgi:hypothetical protein
LPTIPFPLDCPIERGLRCCTIPLSLCNQKGNRRKPVNLCQRTPKLRLVQEWGHEHASQLLPQHGVSNPITGRDQCFAVNGRSVPGPDMMWTKRALFDYFLGTGEQRRRDGKAERLRGLEIDDQLRRSTSGW